MEKFVELHQQGDEFSEKFQNLKAKLGQTEDEDEDE